MWQYTGTERPPFAIEPAQDQESVWDYPRPPRVERVASEIIVMHGDTEIARSVSAWRVLETASPPTVYVPRTDVHMSLLAPVAQQSFCEWKGVASYLALAGQVQGLPVAWFYPQPSAAFAVLADHLSFYPGRVDCFLGDEAVKPQHSEFYGGWITSDIVGPFKGDPGTQGW